MLNQILKHDDWGTVPLTAGWQSQVLCDAGGQIKFYIERGWSIMNVDFNDGYTEGYNDGFGEGYNKGFDLREEHGLEGDWGH